MAAAVLELRERAARDPRTGLGHHATFHDTLPYVRQATRPGRRCAVMIADVDGFKAINDTRGHAAVVARADEALYDVKRRGRDGVRLAPRA
jgi:GGDEF domain-containing protein